MCSYTAAATALATTPASVAAADAAIFATAPASVVAVGGVVTAAAVAAAVAQLALFMRGVCGVCGVRMCVPQSCLRMTGALPNHYSAYKTTFVQDRSQHWPRRYSFVCYDMSISMITS